MRPCPQIYSFWNQSLCNHIGNILSQGIRGQGTSLAMFPHAGGGWAEWRVRSRLLQRADQRLPISQYVCTLRSQKGALCRNRFFQGVIKMRPYWIGVEPNPKNEHPINEEAWQHSQRRSLVAVEAEGAAISQVLSAAGRSWRRQERSCMASWKHPISQSVSVRKGWHRGQRLHMPS